MSEQRAHPADANAFRAVATALGATAMCTLPFAGLVVVAMRSLRRALLAAEKLMHTASSHWSASFMPSALFAIIGLVFGALIGWLVSSSASLGGPCTWLVSLINIAALLLVGAVAAPFVFATGVPNTCWISLAALGLCALVSLYLALAWLD